MNHSPADYKREREARGTQAAVAALLDVSREVVARRETTGPVTHEAFLALCSLRKKRVKKSNT